MDVRERAGSPDRFGYEWARYSTILPESRDQLARWLGSTSLASFAGKSVLDVGCGMGRNPYWMLDAGAKSLIGVDVDDRSLEAAEKNLARFDHAEVRKCSAYDLDPTSLGTFDRVTCIGVLHHLGEPENALAKMWSCVAPGGELHLWCYAREGNRLMLPAIQALRALGSRAPLWATHAIAKAVTASAWPMIRFYPWSTEYYRTLRTLSFANVESIVFDQMLARTSNYWTRDDMQRLVAPLGGSRTVIELVQGNGWHAMVAR
ncbi:MAG TPA: class I SAM-dependent methyltransferase [Labilithrix sp.]|jgi:2-polyprenyl-3-methyl-5-hydroxy-6-metoxy-1,4-benzoquinol methylase